MEFTWHESKNEINIGKHGFDFSDAWKVFEGPMIVSLDTREDYGEDRWIGIGFLEMCVVVVVFTEPSENEIHIISLRKAKKHEQERFLKEIAY